MKVLTIRTATKRLQAAYGTRSGYTIKKVEASYLTVECPEHGEFELIATWFYKTAGCPKCWGRHERDRPVCKRPVSKREPTHRKIRPKRSARHRLTGDDYVYVQLTEKGRVVVLDARATYAQMLALPRVVYIRRTANWRESLGVIRRVDKAYKKTRRSYSIDDLDGILSVCWG